jgi:L,D-peptidoglycan transpeptidase YkuD (ErfK/YbiS/YcfS/YnhG family)
MAPSDRAAADGQSNGLRKFFLCSAGKARTVGCVAVTDAAIREIGRACRPARVS